MESTRCVVRASYESEGLADEAEVLSITQQMCEASAVWTRCVAPWLLLGLTYCYVYDKASGSQAIAAMGIAYASLCVLLYGVFFVACVPFILVSRFLTHCVSDETLSVEEQRETNLYARVALFVTLLCAVTLLFAL